MSSTTVLGGIPQDFRLAKVAFFYRLKIFGIKIKLNGSWATQLEFGDLKKKKIHLLPSSKSKNKDVGQNTNL